MLLSNTSHTPGRLLVFSGVEGSGKSTAIARLKQDFPEPATVYVREPGGTDVGRMIRSILLDQAEPPCPRTQRHLFMADRCQLADQVTWPALKAGRLIVSDRGPESTFAYQDFAQFDQRDVRTFMHQLEDDEIPIPHAFVWFKVDPRIGLERRARSGQMDAMDRKTLDFHQRVAEGYAIFMDGVRPFSQVFEIDASRGPDDLYADAKAIIEQFTTR